MYFSKNKLLLIQLICLIIISILITANNCRKYSQKQKNPKKVTHFTEIPEPVLDYGEDTSEEKISEDLPDNDLQESDRTVNVSLLDDITNAANEEAKIVGGSTTQVKRYPWMAAIMRSGKSTPFCGGSLINQNTIVTAGHCVKNESPGSIKIRLGSTEMGSGRREAGARDYSVKSLKLHPRYKYPLNDIAIIKLKSNVKFGKFIKPIAIDGSGAEFTGRSAKVAGWGTTSYGGRQSRKLKEVGLKVWNHSQCNKAIKDFPITSGMICAGDPNGQRKDACQGDSGGPLMTTAGSSWRLIGVVSFGDKCGKPNMPGVYTRVNKYAGWIRSQAG